MALNFNVNKEAEKAIVDAAPLQEKAPAKKEKRDTRVSLTMKASELEIMDRFCEKSGLTRSSFFRLAGFEYIKTHT